MLLQKTGLWAYLKPKILMDVLKQMLAEQQANLAELSSEVQRKEVTPVRVVRLIKIVSREVEILERMLKVLESINDRLHRLSK